MDKTRVAIIGCGPSGMSALAAFNQSEKSGDVIPDIVCFEKQDTMGGLWNYTWQTGTDKYGEQCHNSMYRHLYSNGPKEVLEMGDYSFEEHFGKAIPSFPPREVLRDYLMGKAKKNDVVRFLRLNTVVRHVVPDADGNKFTVTSQNLKTKEEKKEVFDYVICATGHFSVPNLPVYPGVEQYDGIVMHSHDFRDANAFKGRKLLMIGNHYSAEDIALQCKKYGCNDITISYRTRPTGFKWPEGIHEIPQLDRYEDGAFHFIDGSSGAYDVLMFCTGYKHHFPFMADTIRLNTTNSLFVDGLYKGVVLNTNPRVMYLGMHDVCFTFTLFDAQACFARDYILGKIEHKDEDGRNADMKAWGERFTSTVKDNYTGVSYQSDYISDLLEHCVYPEHGHEKRAAYLHSWLDDRQEDIAAYRDKAYTSVMTGHLATTPSASWMENKSDETEILK